MTLTFLDLYNECAGQPWSMFDNDATSVEDLESALKISINKAASFLWNYQPWSFRIKTNQSMTKANVNKYLMPDGTIVRKVNNDSIKYGIRCNGNRLSYIEDYDSLDDKTGEPESFWVEGEYFYLYPTPDNRYTITVDYLSIPYCINEDNKYIYEMENESDRIDIPEKYEKIFSNSLISLAMMYAIADETDENYSGYRKQYEDSLSVLFKYCRDKSYDRKIVW